MPLSDSMAGSPILSSNEQFPTHLNLVHSSTGWNAFSRPLRSQGRVDTAPKKGTRSEIPMPPIGCAAPGLASVTMTGAPVLFMQYENLIYLHYVIALRLPRSIPASEIVKTPHIVVNNEQICILTFLFHPLLYLCSTDPQYIALQHFCSYNGTTHSNEH